MKEVSYRRGLEELVAGGGMTFGLDDSGEGFIASLSDAEEVSLTSLRKALGRYAAECRATRAHLRVVDMPAARLDDDVLIDPTELIWDQGELRVAKDVVFTRDPPSNDDIVARIQGLLPRRRQTLAAVSGYQDRGLWIVTVEVGLATRAATVGSAVTLAGEVQALAWASLDDIATVTALVKAGLADLLVGSYESDWLDVKRDPYRDDPAGELELAKDVAAYANSDGGLLLIGLKTKNDGHGDRIRAVNQCALDPALPGRYRRVIKRHVHPTVDGLTIDLVPGTSRGQGVIVIEVPAQPEGAKPFLVNGVVRDGRVEGAYFAVPVRSGADTEFLDIRVLHGRLRAGTAYLAGTTEPDARPRPGLHDRDPGGHDPTEPDHHPTVPEFLRELVSAAGRHGLTIERARNSIAFRGRHGELVVASSEESGPLADSTARQTLLENLARAGLPVHRSEGGRLTPDLATRTTDQRKTG